MFDATAADSSASFFQSLDPTLQSTFVTGLAQVPEVALELAHTQLANFFSEPDFLDVLRIPFGDFDEAQATALAQDFMTGDFSNLLQIEILAAGVLQGANGGFDSLTGTIYLADNFLIDNVDNPAAIANVLLEEIGHYIDAQINRVDSPGDEGEIFSAIVQGQSLTTEDLARLQAEDDTATIVVGDRSILIEKSDFAGNTLGTARNIGTLSGTQTFRDFVGSTDTNDFYRFNLANRSNFRLTLNGMSANADVQLIRDTNNNGIVDSGEVLASSVNTGTTPDSISRTLDPGTYFVRVYPFGIANTNYNLNLTANPLDGAGNTLRTARNIGTLSGTQTFSDFVGSTDTNDFYRFNVASRSNFSLTLNGMSANADVELIRDANNNGIVDSGEVLASSTNGSTTADTISRTLDAGNYFVRVYPFGTANTNYTLNLTATPAGPVDGAGNTLGTARNIGTLSGTQTFSDFVGSTDTNDFYRFSVASRSNFSLTLNGMSANADVELIRDANNNGIVDSGEVLASSTNGSTTADTISRTLDAGNYFVRVYPFGTANTNYNLSLTATPTTPSPTGSFNIQFDYRFDTNGFFSNPARRAALEAAADIWEAIIRDEFADVPAGTNLYVRNPQTVNTMQYVTAGTIDDVLVFVGSRYIDGPFGTSADGGPSATYPSGSNLESRWRGSDFEPWTGSLSFDSGDNWFFDSTPTTANDIPFNTIDFISVAVHELGHVLGFVNVVNAFNSQISGGYFNGPIARSVYGGPVPMQGSHISPTAGTHAMTPSGMAGTRTLPTNLDRAILDDIGYTVNYA